MSPTPQVGDKKQGQEEEVATGFVQLYPMFSSVRARRTWVLNDLFVEAQFRRGGIAGSLTSMQVAEEDFAKGKRWRSDCTGNW